jgi:hypothetical protein
MFWDGKTFKLRCNIDHFIEDGILKSLKSPRHCEARSNPQLTEQPCKLPYIVRDCFVPCNDGIKKSVSTNLHRLDPQQIA